jgi:hypothetical protein
MGGISMDRDLFNPRSREGSDRLVDVYKGSPALFQSTLPRGERQSRRSGWSCRFLSFNPRSREKSDGYSNTFKASQKFQSTLRRGATASRLNASVSAYYGRDGADVQLMELHFARPGAIAGDKLLKAASLRRARSRPNRAIAYGPRYQRVSIPSSSGDALVAGLTELRGRTHSSTVTPSGRSPEIVMR